MPLAWEIEFLEVPIRNYISEHQSLPKEFFSFHKHSRPKHCKIKKIVVL